MDNIETHYKMMVELNDMIKYYEENNRNYFIKKEYDTFVQDEIISDNMYKYLDTRYY